MPMVKSDPEVIRKVKADISNAIKEIQAAVNNIRMARNSASGWNDNLGNQYRDLMTKIERLAESPISTLQAALPYLDKLAKSLDAYNRVKF
ncbi:MAG: WXG100 family type VII secretion target [Defluviitaleaceae bacterium]|nr:WXG100 family type VII secretion target [Defluviitaleaceae bacterium]